MIQDDAAKPGGKRRVAPELPQGAEGGQKGVLDDVAGLLVIPYHPVGHIEHLFLVPPDEDGKGIRIALAAKHEDREIVIVLLFVNRMSCIGYLRQYPSSCPRLPSEAIIPCFTTLSLIHQASRPALPMPC
jgi:hypothetical protein